MRRSTGIVSALLLAGMTFLAVSALLTRVPPPTSGEGVADAGTAQDQPEGVGGLFAVTRETTSPAARDAHAREGEAVSRCPGRPQPEDWSFDLPAGEDLQPAEGGGVRPPKKDLAADVCERGEAAAPNGGGGAVPPSADTRRDGGNTDPQMTGCRKPTAEELAWMKANLVDEKVVKPNGFGLKRINDWRKKQGLKPVTLEDVARSRAARTGVAVPGLAAAPSEKTLAPTELVGAPAAVDNSQLQYFPPIRTQGSLGSCACFSTTYYTMTYMVARANGWDVTGTENTNKFSPKWTYNMINGGTNNGSWITTAFYVMRTNGCATWSDFPYQTSTSPATNYREWSTDGDVWLNAINYRMSTAGSISSMNNDTGINNLKDKLNDGYIVNFATHIYDWTYDQSVNNPDSSLDDAYVGEDVCYTQAGGTENSGHAMTIVGYNDYIWVDLDEDGERDTNEVGAFRIANSWGASWREGGFCWYLYSAVKENGNWWSNTVYWIDARTSYEPKMVARFTVNHLKRNQMTMSVGIGDTGDSVPDSTFYSYALSGDGGAYAFDGTTTACDGEFCLDFTDLCPAVGVNKRWFLRFYDSSSGAETGLIKSFTLYNVTRAETVGTVTPGANPANFNPSDGTANASYAYAFINGNYQDNSNTAPSISNIANQSTQEDTAKGPIAFTVSDAQTAAGDLIVSGTSDNQGVVPDSGISFGGSGGSRTVTLTPEANAYGTATITVTVSDGGLTDQDTFTLTVTSVNDDPVISTYDPSTPFSMDAGTSQVFEIWPHDDDGDTLTYSWELDGGGISETDTDHEYSPMPGEEGSHAITVTVNDGHGGTDSHTWNITVNAASVPYIGCSVVSLGPSVKKGGDAAEQTFTVANAGAGTMSYSVGKNQSWLSCSPTSGSSSGEADTITVTYTTSALDVGTYNATITITDTNPGTASNSPVEIPVTLTVKKKSSGGGGGGCALAAGADAAGGLLPYLGLALAWLLGRRKRR